MIEKEKALDNYPKPVTIEGSIKIIAQLKNSICKIENKNGNGTGFFCYIPYKKEKLKVLITNNHIINEEIIKENDKIQVSINDNKKYKIIELKNKKIYTNKNYDITIIEIKSENIDYFLELDEEILNQDIISINNKSVYILQYPNSLEGQKAAVSYGIIKGIKDEYNIIHYCCTENGSSGSPIMNLFNNKIIGIHKESVKDKNYNRGTLLKYPINKYKQYFNNNIIIKEKEDNKILFPGYITKTDNITNTSLTNIDPNAYMVYVEILRNELNSPGVDYDAIAKIIASTIYQERVVIRRIYIQIYNEDLVYRLKIELSVDFKEAVIGSFLNPTEYMMHIVLIVP